MTDSQVKTILHLAEQDGVGYWVAAHTHDGKTIKGALFSHTDGMLHIEHADGLEGVTRYFSETWVPVESLSALTLEFS